MGRDITPIGNHQLNTDNIQKLAEDICSRVDINIEYGYGGTEEHFKLLGQNKKDQTLTLGRIIKDKSLKTYFLNDTNYQLKELHAKFGDELFYRLEYWTYNDEIPNETIIEEEKRTLIFPTYWLREESEDEQESMSIYKELYSNDMKYYDRWWPLCRFFTNELYQNPDYLKHFIEYRKILMKYTTAFGGNKIYLLDDQSNVLEGVGQGSEWDYNWEDFENFVFNKTSKLQLNIPQFFTNEIYRKDFLSKHESPLSFVDDFSDLI